jgi:hypothetical protein
MSVEAHAYLLDERPDVEVEIDGIWYPASSAAGGTVTASG